eukprot:3970486-Amphidinium_carterae.1
MSSEAAASEHLSKYGWQPSKYSRRYIDYSIEIIYDGHHMREKVDISHFMQIKSIWGSIMESPFSPSAD